MSDFKKIVNVGRISDGKVFCVIEYKEGKLTISGVVGPRSNGSCRGSCGQINESVEEVEEYAAGWNFGVKTVFLEFWDAYHLNDLQAGTVAQAALVKGLSYEEACIKLKENDLYIDDGYKYGSGWLSIDVPKSALNFLEALPDTTITPAWV